jgi:uncharacterized protein (TIGR04141 family)
LPRKPRLRRLNLFLLKETVEEWSDALKDPAGPITSHEVGIDGGEVLVIKTTNAKAPWWVHFLASQVRPRNALEQLANRSSSALLFIVAEGRRFALAFGYGRTLLRPEAYEQDFGLKVVLNTVAPDQLRSIDARTFDELTVHTRRDVSRASSFEAFGLDISRDLVRAVTGKLEDDTLGSRATGADALSLATRAQPEDLQRLCGQLLGAYESDRYKERFGWIDHVRRVRDPSVVSDLDQSLIVTLRSGDLEDIHMAPPEPMDWMNLEGFLFSTDANDGEPYTDPPISAYLASLDEPGEISLEQLKADRVLGLGGDQAEVIVQWSVYRCLVFETRCEGDVYALTCGEWYRVSGSFSQEVIEFVQGLPLLDLELPPASLGISERDYNQRAAEATGALCLDRQLVQMPGRDPVEICDLLTNAKQLIHVKKRQFLNT